jgi:hypothetical protein
MVLIAFVVNFLKLVVEIEVEGMLFDLPLVEIKNVD